MSATSRVTGFTLTELALTLVVVAILSGMAVTSLSGLASARQNVAATRVRTALVHAQEWAMGSHNKTWVAFDAASDLVSVYVEDPSNPGKANRLALSDPLTRSAMTIQLGSDGVGIDSASFGGTVEVQFDPAGSPSDANGNALAADGTVGVSGGGTIRVTRNTGLVTVD
jgi:prepilin-type N-terminal cleavage/methylation domain-containing protein